MANFASAPISVHTRTTVSASSSPCVLGSPRGVAGLAPFAPYLNPRSFSAVYSGNAALFGGAGPHQVDLAAAHPLPAGLYLVRLRRGADQRVTRVTLLE